MARLHEYQGKEMLKQFKIPVPKGGVARTPEEARQIAQDVGGEVMVKAQAWVTGRASLGGIKKADTPAQAEEWDPRKTRSFEARPLVPARHEVGGDEHVGAPTQRALLVAVADPAVDG